MKSRSEEQKETLRASIDAYLADLAARSKVVVAPVRVEEEIVCTFDVGPPGAAEETANA